MKKYKAKVSKALLLFIFLVFYGPLFIPPSLGQNWSIASLIFLLFITLVFFIIIYFLYSTVYIIQEKQLIIKIGFYSYKPISISAIKEIRKTNNIISSPAPSLDRIEIIYGSNKSIIISPENKEKFMQDILNINNEIILKK